MANTLTIVHKRRAAGDNRIAFVFKCILSGSYVQSSGITTGIGSPGEILAFNNALNPNFIARPKLPSVLNGSLGALPQTNDVTIEGMPAGYSGRVERNATSPTANNFVLRIFTPAGTELTAGTYASVAPALIDTVGVIIACQVPAKYN